jgi:predicted GNAT family acetyltransferase
MELVVADNPDESRYEAMVDGEVAAFINYHLSHNGIALTHTQTDPRFRGKGVAGRLVQSTLDDAAARGLAVLPFCPFVKSWLGEHPAYVKLVPEDRRAEFGL